MKSRNHGYLRRLRASGWLRALPLIALTGACLLESSGPDDIFPGRIAIAPSFSAGTPSGLGLIDRARLLVARQATGEPVGDQVVRLEVGATSISLEVVVPVKAPDEVFSVRLALIGLVGDTLFRAGPIEVRAAIPPAQPSPVSLPLLYVGIGANARDIVITTLGLLKTLTGDTITLSAIARDSAGNPIPNAPIAWRTLDPAIALVPNVLSPKVVAGALRGSARIVAQLVTGQADTINVGAVPLPVSLSTIAGDRQ